MNDPLSTTVNATDGFITYHRRDGGIIGKGNTPEEAEADVAVRCAAYDMPTPPKEDLDTIPAPGEIMIALETGTRFSWTKAGGAAHMMKD